MPVRPAYWTVSGVHPILIAMNDRCENMDPLGEALHYLRLSGTFYCRSELTAPWALALPPREGALSFHVVTAGHCWLEVDGAESQRLDPGDLALVPHGAGHRLASEPGLPAPPIEALRHEAVSERYALLRHGGGGDSSCLVCGAVRFEHPTAQLLVNLLPRLIHIHTANPLQMDWTQSTLQLMAAEAQALRPGGETVITRSADILVVQAIRSWLEQDPQARTGWLGALGDPQIGRAIAQIHREPARPWTVASLAAEAAMSRSAFAARFTDRVGEPAMHYVARWRMHLAHAWLQEERFSLPEIATRLGYDSEAAFRRAFKRHVGLAPGKAGRSATLSPESLT